MNFLDHRMKNFLLRIAECITALLLATSGAWAADDHGHDHGTPAPATSSAAPRRFAAESEAFELVGVLNGRQLTLYLDRFADNSPVQGAALDLDIDGVKVKAEPHGEGEFLALLQAEPGAGTLSITATVAAGTQTDLLAGELKNPEKAHVDEASGRPRWQFAALWTFGALAVIAVLMLARRRKVASRQIRLGGAA